MLKKYTLLFCLALLAYVTTFAQATPKKPLTHDVYDSWKKLEKPLFSNNGNFCSYEMNPQKGDGWLHLATPDMSRHDSVYRAQGAIFSPGSELLVFRIAPPADTLRKLKLAKKKKDEMPKDSLGIWLLAKDSVMRFPGLKSFQLPKEGGAWVAWLYEKPKEKEKKQAADSIQKTSQDTLVAKPKENTEKPKDKKKKKGAFTDIETANLTLLTQIPQ